MASRQEEKEARRKERLEREAKEAAAASRSRRLQLVGGALLGAAAIAAIVVVLLSVGGADPEIEAQSPSATAAAGAKLPAQESSNYEEAAKAAGCTLANPAFEGQDHEEKDFTPADFKTNPPTSGNHFPQWYDDGVYAPGTTDNLGMLVHTLEHGRVNVQYKKGTPADVVGRLEALLAEQNEGYHMLLYENTTGMAPQIAATAWTHSLSCPEMNEQVFDAIRTFKARYINKGPENVP